ncbi:septal ring lytic transglycosylase RlpA family protein [Pontibacter anaerobius]|uniref:Probable endolytic peptidoglycan transglycosylase RlpA n=1 Tax=Pontibacter anaerobius TaxID=2993940 RepID=A0ABT3RBB6_9BACT|nr:septal ring lytic transglycosylase RlpA family protein [Pontibacter anaerobius]MCX2739154.1 septal ring lytic transglycosylase RlpA family protein [Pontibacter anaerobius]
MNLYSVVLIFLLSFSSGPADYNANGKASYYADRFHGQRTANGERYDKNLLTAAHATLPFNTKVQVTNLKNGKTVTVRINDRMAHSRHRLIDLSRAAAKELDMVRDGTASVSIKELAPEEAQQETPFAVSEAEATPKQ